MQGLPFNSVFHTSYLDADHLMTDFDTYRARRISNEGVTGLGINQALSGAEESQK